MPELTLHFETDQGTDIHAVAAEVQQKLQVIDGVTSANAEAMELRTMGGLEIIAVISLVTTVVQNTSTLLKAVDDLVNTAAISAPTFPDCTSRRSRSVYARCRSIR